MLSSSLNKVPNDKSDSVKTSKFFKITLAAILIVWVLFFKKGERDTNIEIRKNVYEKCSFIFFCQIPKTLFRREYIFN